MLSSAAPSRGRDCLFVCLFVCLLVHNSRDYPAILTFLPIFHYWLARGTRTAHCRQNTYHRSSSSSFSPLLFSPPCLRLFCSLLYAAILATRVSASHGPMCGVPWGDSYSISMSPRALEERPRPWCFLLLLLPPYRSPGSTAWNRHSQCTAWMAPGSTVSTGARSAVVG